MHKEKWGSVGAGEGGGLWPVGSNLLRGNITNKEDSGYINLTRFLLKADQGDQTSPGAGGEGRTGSSTEGDHIARKREFCEVNMTEFLPQTDMQVQSRGLVGKGITVQLHVESNFIQTTGIHKRPPSFIHPNIHLFGPDSHLGGK